MKVLGIDPSSSCSGVALIEYTGLNKPPAILWTKTWKKNDKKSAPQNLYDYFSWLREDGLSDGYDTDYGPQFEPVADLACIEFLSVTRNAQTSRVVSHYQAASVLACKELGMTVIEARVSSARKEALGKSGSKEEAWEEIKKLYPGHKFKSKTSGGMDEADAVVLAMAARGLAER